MKYIIVLILTCLVYADSVVSQNGDMVTINASAEYIMGDSDSRQDAKAFALTQAKLNATEIAGTYIQSNFELISQQKNGIEIDKITKQAIKSFSSGIINTRIVDERLELLTNQSTVYKISIRAIIDLAVFRERIKQLNEDTIKKEKLARLEKENQRLLNTLLSLNQQLKNTILKKDELKVLQEERDSIFSKIENNENSVKLIFETRTVLTEYERKNQEAKRIAQVVNGVFENNRLRDFVKINIERPEIIDENGNIYTVKFNFSWIFDSAKMVKYLKDNKIKIQVDDEGNELYDEQVISLGNYSEFNGLVEKYVNRYHPCIVFLLPNEKIYFPLFNQNHRITNFRCQDSGSFEFKVSKKQFENLSEIKAIIDGNCKQFAYDDCAMG